MAPFLGVKFYKICDISGGLISGVVVINILERGHLGESVTGICERVVWVM